MNRIKDILNKHLVRGIFLGMFAILLFRAGGADAAALSENCGIWKAVPTPPLDNNLDQLLGVAAISTNDVWAVGDRQGYTQTLTEHWDGAQWSVVPSPSPGANNNRLTTVAAVSTNDVWAVGYSSNLGTYFSLIEHWDGSSWSEVSSPGRGLFSIVVISATNIWAVGADELIVHWDGTSWTTVSNPIEGKGGTFDGITAISVNDIWAVGAYTPGHRQSLTMTEHWDGTQWSIVPSPSPSANVNSLVSVAAVSANDVWAVGGYSTPEVESALTEHWDGTQWSIVPFPPQQPYEGLDAVAAVASNDVWSVGTAIANWNGMQWNNRPLASFPALSGIAIVSATDIWAVGTNVNYGGETVILHYSC